MILISTHKNEICSPDTTFERSCIICKEPCNQCTYTYHDLALIYRLMPNRPPLPWNPLIRSMSIMRNDRLLTDVAAPPPPPNHLITPIQLNLNCAPHSQSADSRPHTPLTFAHPVIQTGFGRGLEEFQKIACGQVWNEG